MDGKFVWGFVAGLGTTWLWHRYVHPMSTTKAG